MGVSEASDPQYFKKCYNICMKSFTLQSDFQPKGDQKNAIDELVRGLNEGKREMVLMGVTGSGKTFTMANVIEKANRPVLVISHNKTLAAQLYQEFKGFFPGNAVEYFVSYYDYYQPEAFVPASNTYIAKEATINDEIDRMRLKATNTLFHRRDVIIVASVSCIYGIGAPDTYISQSFRVETGKPFSRKDLLARLVDAQYMRKDDELTRGTFRVRGGSIDLYPAYTETAYRIQIEKDTVCSIETLDPLLGTVSEAFDQILVYPRTFFSTPQDILDKTVIAVEKELEERLIRLKADDKDLEAGRLEERTLYDLDMLREFGWCPGIENYSLYLSGRSPGQPPYTLLNYFPDDFLIIIDESHVTVPQISGMYHGDRSRKQTLIEHGFRLPSALDNRPLNFEEFEERIPQVFYISATPGAYERKKTGNRMVEQIIRPTGLADPVVEVRPVKGQIDDLMSEIQKRADADERCLVTTLTKKMAENLTRHYHDLGLRVRYLHSDIETLDRVKILRDLRLGKFDALIGINLLREGLDLPEVSLVAVLDADKEGFLRSDISLIQTFGRAARNINGRVILYADMITPSMKRAMDETDRRRLKQLEYNIAHNITPRTIEKRIEGGMGIYEKDYYDISRIAENKEVYLSPAKRLKKIREMERLMQSAVKSMDFEKAARWRDEINRLKKAELELKPE